MRKKIFISFLIVAVVPAIITIIAANMFARRELEDIRRRNATTGLARLDANVVEEMARVGSAAKNGAADQEIRRILARRRQLGSVFQAQLINQITERNRKAGWDFSAIIDTNGVILARGDYPSSYGDTIDYRSVFGVQTIDKPIVSGSPPLEPYFGTGGLLGIAPIEWQEQRLAYLIVGTDFTARRLREWVGGWAIPSMIVGDGIVLNQSEDIPEAVMTAELYDDIYAGPPVSSVYLNNRRYLVGRERLTRMGSGKPPLMILIFFDSKPVDMAVEKLLYSLLATAALGLLLALVFGAMVARMLTRPLDDITQAADRISAGDWDADVINFTGGEAGRMADAFNRMIGDLRRSRDRLVQSERIGAWRDAARKVAHEIKNPLSPIQIAAEDLKAAYKPDDPQFAATLNQAVRMITEEVDSIKRFIDEFASFARTPRPTFGLVGINKLIAEACGVFAAEEKAGRIIKPVIDTITIQGDFELLKKALVNLIKNGLEASAPDGQVLLTAIEEDETAIITIDDTGKGFSPEIKDRLFTPYATDKQDGTGLGLVIVQGIIVDHGGIITADENTDGGARFVIRLPKNPPRKDD